MGRKFYFYIFVHPPHHTRRSGRDVFNFWIFHLWDHFFWKKLGEGGEGISVFFLVLVMTRFFSKSAKVDKIFISHHEIISVSSTDRSLKNDCIIYNAPSSLFVMNYTTRRPLLFRRFMYTRVYRQALRCQEFPLLLELHRKEDLSKYFLNDSYFRFDVNEF